MPKGYWIASVDVHDDEAYKPYAAANPAIFKKFGGRFVVRAGRFECPEGYQLLRPRGRREHLRTVSDRAALAVLVHDLISTPDFGRCYGGFVGCISPAELHLTCT